MSHRLFKYFTEGTQRTKTGASFGIEVETSFFDWWGRPPRPYVTKDLIAKKLAKLELGVQNLEVSNEAQSAPTLALEAMRLALVRLYDAARWHGLYPRFRPDVTEEEWPDPLLFVEEERDWLWLQIDDKKDDGNDSERSLEQLARCSSVQFTVSVNPEDAIDLINRLWAAKVHEVDYAPNDARWRKYIATSRASYRPDRYGGPEAFEDLEDYCRQLAQHPVVMHHGQPVRTNIDELDSPDIDLFLRSVWWHSRLRRYGDTLALEIRPFARRTDDNIWNNWQLIASVLGL